MYLYYNYICILKYKQPEFKVSPNTLLLKYKNSAAYIHLIYSHKGWRLVKNEGALFCKDALFIKTDELCQCLIFSYPDFQTSQRPVVPASLRPLKTLTSLQWADFAIAGDGESVGGRSFLPATWGSNPVSLCLATGQARLPTCFAPITQFFDLVASQFLHQDKTELVQGWFGVSVVVSFLPWSF